MTQLVNNLVKLHFTNGRITRLEQHDSHDIIIMVVYSGFLSTFTIEGVDLSLKLPVGLVFKFFKCDHLRTGSQEDN